MGAPTAKPPLLKRMLHQVGHPVLSYFDRRFEDLRTSSRASGLEVITEVSRDTDTISELTLSIERLVSRYGARLDSTVDAIDRLLDVAGPTLAPGSPDGAARQLIGLPLADLGPGAAALFDWVMSDDGPSGQAGAWVRPLVEIEHGPGRVAVARVSSLVVEAPIAHAVALRLPAGSRVLVVAGTGSVLPLELACLGLRVTALVPAGFSPLHPYLEIVVDQPLRWPGPDQPFDAAFCLSGCHPGGPDDPSRMLALIRQWLSPTGQVLLSVPLGLPATDDAGRGCDTTGIEALFREDWVVQHVHVFDNLDPLVWARRPDEPGAAPTSPPEPGVAVVDARLRE